MPGAESCSADDPRIAQALVGAGIAVLYATTYGSHILYALIDPATTGALMAAVTGGGPGPVAAPWRADRRDGPGRRLPDADAGRRSERRRGPPARLPRLARPRPVPARLAPRLDLARRRRGGAELPVERLSAVAAARGRHRRRCLHHPARARRFPAPSGPGPAGWRCMQPMAIGIVLHVGAGGAGRSRPAGLGAVTDCSPRPA